MALIKCPECGKDVSDKAEKCIHCGYGLLGINSNLSTDSMYGSGALTSNNNYGSGPLSGENNYESGPLSGNNSYGSGPLSGNDNFGSGPLSGNDNYGSGTLVSYPNTAQSNCSKCGAIISLNDPFCPKCGNRIGSNNSLNQKKGSKKVPIIIASAAILICAIVLIFIFTHTVKGVELESDDLEIKVDDSQTIGYSITPENAIGADVTWSSSDTSIAEVDNNGRITGKDGGSCKITISAGKYTDTIEVTVKAGPDFKSIYDKYCESEWANVGSDGSYLSIDTNPHDKDDYIEYDAFSAISKVNEAIGLPESLADSMLSTTALMGRQTETYDKLGVTVSWAYHPDNGLEVSYKSID